MPDTVLSLIRAQAHKTPDAPAVLGPDKVASYRAVMARSAAVAGHLVGLGLPVDAPVALLMVRRADLVGTVLGIWQAGLSYLPIDPQEPPQRVRHMLALADCTTLLGDADLCAPIIDHPDTGPVQFVNATTARAASEDAGSVDAAGARAEGLAYVLFTSGSTGIPKAVEVEHRALAHVLCDAITLLGIRQDDCYLACASVGFDISLAELFAPLMTGARVVLRDRETLLNPAALAQDIQNHAITMMQTGPTVWATLLGEMPNFPRLRVAISTGEALWSHQATLITKIADTVWNLYGPTETTIWASGHKVTPDNLPAAAGRVPIGSLLGGARALICGDDGHEVAAGQTGELLISGACLARGYRNQPAQTRDCFITRQGVRYYKTGDLVRRDADGALHYLGRRDDQIKLHGIRVEPAEIEQVLCTCPGIQDAAVTWFETALGAMALVAAVVVPRDDAATRMQVQAHLATHLPAQRIPARLFFMPRLPLSKNGKVDRLAIRQLAMNNAKPDAETAALTPHETTVASIWARMMRMESVSPDDNFFAIGGDSLAAVTMTLKLEVALYRPVSTLLVLQYPVLRDFCAQLDAPDTGEAPHQTPDFLFPMVTHAGTNPVYFCGADLRLAKSWDLPVSLCVLAYWADGIHIISAASIEALAGHYVAGIRSQQPTGPYRLAGYSFGAVLAFEIAQQLCAIGAEVETLILLDPYKPFHAPQVAPRSAPPPPRQKAARFLQKRARIFRANLRRLNPFRQKNGFMGWFAPFLTPIAKIPGGIRFVYWINHLHRRYPNPVAAALLERWKWPVFWYNARKLLVHYHIRPYHGRTLALFTPDQNGQDDWAKLLSAHATYTAIEGRHHEMFEVESVAHWLPLVRFELERSDDLAL